LFAFDRSAAKSEGCRAEVRSTQPGGIILKFARFGLRLGKLR